MLACCLDHEQPYRDVNMTHRNMNVIAALSLSLLQTELNEIGNTRGIKTKTPVGSLQKKKMYGTVQCSLHKDILFIAALKTEST